MLEILEKGLGKPSLRNNVQNSGTPAHDNNNTTKVINGSTTNLTPVTTAIQNTNASEVTVIKQEREDVQQTVNVNANVNVIELKPTTTMIKLEPKMEIDIRDLNNITFSSDDLNALDNSLTLDPALNDLALQVCPHENIISFREGFVVATVEWHKYFELMVFCFYFMPRKCFKARFVSAKVEIALCMYLTSIFCRTVYSMISEVRISTSTPYLPALHHWASPSPVAYPPRPSQFRQRVCR